MKKDSQDSATRDDLQALRDQVQDTKLIVSSLYSTMAHKLLTVSEVAERLGCSARTVERLIASGQLVPIRFGTGQRRSQRRFSVEQIEALLREGRGREASTTPRGQDADGT